MNISLSSLEWSTHNSVHFGFGWLCFHGSQDVFWLVIDYTKHYLYQPLFGNYLDIDRIDFEHTNEGIKQQKKRWQQIYRAKASKRIKHNETMEYARMRVCVSRLF